MKAILLLYFQGNVLVFFVKQGYVYCMHINGDIILRMGIILRIWTLSIYVFLFYLNTAGRNGLLYMIH